MGHDISARRFKVRLPFEEKSHDDDVIRLSNGVEVGEEVAYVRFSAGNVVGQFLFYESLDAQKFNSGCSGDGGDEVFSTEQINLAKEKLNYLGSDEGISSQIGSYSQDEKHNMFKNLISMLGGTPSEIFSKENKEAIKCELEKINGFYDAILNCGDTEIYIGFW